MKKYKFIPYNPQLKERAKDNRLNPSKAESKIWNEIFRKKLIKYKFLRQKPLDRFIVDFYCAKLMLAVEIDGDTHANQRQYDRMRTEKLNILGIKVIRYSNIDVMRNIEGVYEDLNDVVKQRAGELDIEPL